MPIDRSSAGDPARTLNLLWRAVGSPAARRGPPPGLSVEQIVQAAITVADREGLDAVTMRRVAHEVGVVPMSLYTYVPTKGELLDLMLDSLYGQMPRPELAARPWRDRLAAIADDNWLLLTAHPWAATVSTLRPPLGPGLAAKYEHELRALDGLGLSDLEMDATLTFLLGFVQTTARWAAEAAATQRETALSDAQWWAATAPLLTRVITAETYPTAMRVGTAAGDAHGAAYDPAHAYAFGLQRVLDGIAALIAAHSKP